MTATRVEPSKGAMRAAHLVAEEYDVARNFGRMAAPWHENLASIIDRETKAGEIKESLRELVKVIQSVTNIDDGVCYFNGRYMGALEKPLERAERLLSELEGKE